MTRTSRSVVGAVVVVMLTMFVAACGSSGTDSSTTGTQSQTTTEHTHDEMSTSSMDDANKASDSKTATTSDDPKNADTTTHLHIDVVNGTVSGDTSAQITRGNDVMIHVTSDVADTVHVHGYDIEFAVEPNVERWIIFKADIAGQWDVETHESNRVLTTLTVK